MTAAGEGLDRELNVQSETPTRNTVLGNDTRKVIKNNDKETKRGLSMEMQILWVNAEEMQNDNRRTASD